MGAIRSPQPVLPILAAFSRHAEALEWARQRAAQAWSKIALASAPFEFDETDYYQATMGAGLKKQFLAFGRPCPPDALPAMKTLTNAWEQEYAQAAHHRESRPLNLDPGYLTLAKLVLASTKDHAHRLYMGAGIFAEVTLQWRQGAWQAMPWTFPDYRRSDYHEFFSRCRAFLNEQRVGEQT